MSIVWRGTEWFEVGEKEPPVMEPLVAMVDLWKSWVGSSDQKDLGDLITRYRTYWDGEKWVQKDPDGEGMVPCWCQDVVYWTQPGDWIGESMVKGEGVVVKMDEADRELSEADDLWWEFDPKSLSDGDKEWLVEERKKAEEWCGDSEG